MSHDNTTLPTANHIAIDPEFVVNIIEEFPEYLQTKENYVKLATWYARQWEALDAEVIKLGYFRLLDNATGILLDNIGALVGVIRYEQSDESYRALIKLRSLRQITNGTRAEIVNLLTLIFYNQTPSLYKGTNGFMEVTVPKACLDYATLVKEIEDLFTISTNLWIVENVVNFPLQLVDQKTLIQPTGTGGLSDQKIEVTGGILSNWIHSSAKSVKF